MRDCFNCSSVVHSCARHCIDMSWRDQSGPHFTLILARLSLHYGNMSIHWFRQTYIGGSMVGRKWLRLASLAWKINKLYTFSSLVFYLIPKDNLFKRIYLSKALTCMKMFLYKQELLFSQRDGYHWPNYCMNNLYI